MDRDEAISHAYAVFSAGDREGFIARLAPDIVLRTSGVMPGMDAEYRGHDGARRWWDHLRDIWERFTIEPRIEDAAGDLSLIAIRLRALGAGSGVEVEQRVWHIVRLDGAMAREHWSFWDYDRARAAFQDLKTDRPG